MNKKEILNNKHNCPFFNECDLGEKIRKERIKQLILDNVPFKHMSELNKVIDEIMYCNTCYEQKKNYLNCATVSNKSI